jgi:hypothetical protein
MISDIYASTIKYDFELDRLTPFCQIFFLPLSPFSALHSTNPFTYDL